ncbi:glycosyltransferase family 4 protein [Priestia sp. Y58]|uniref:glycosyltransferase family 4 protein n=1 Tax=Priestia sp. Y58 TaxID=2922804 RepID=UPI0024053612|nr:glycosyltransferase family 4 protein [Priestia sp. Y58]MDG0030619.1 glycosyltransferase family 4 protein [Priestia sp. Y58]
MRLFFIGDFYSENGPSSVNKALKKIMPDNTLYSVETKPYKRIIELLIKIRQADLVLFSGLSKVNIIGFKIAKLLRKKAAYLMHGSHLIEGKLNQNLNKSLMNIENKVLELAPVIICVSENFVKYVKEYYPQHSDKTTYVNNGVDWNMIGLAEYENTKRNKNMLLSVGGGIPLKKIEMICKAVNHLNSKEGYNLEFTVIGTNGSDTHKIKSYPFVTYIEKVDKRNMAHYYTTAQLYIQNSEFETFGLATVEALICGCNILISKNVGALSIINALEENDLIYDINSIEEISRKIAHNLLNNNNSRLIKSVEKDNTSIEASYKKIISILEKSRNSDVVKNHTN